MKSGRALGLEELPKILGSLIIFLQPLRHSAQLGFAKDRHKLTRRRKGGVTQD